MAEQAINFQNGQHHAHKFRVSGLNSISSQIPMETSLYEVPGAIGMEWGARRINARKDSFTMLGRS
jgi:hypothetical protein